MPNIQTFPSQQTAEALLWQRRIITVGGGFESNSLLVANNLARILHTRGYYPKIKYLLPLLGTGVAAAMVPLVDVLNVGAATNVNFVNADFSQSTGLQGNGTTKNINPLLKPGQVGTSNNGGFGYWDTNISFPTSSDAMGCTTTSDNRYVIDLRATPVRNFRWGSPGNGAGDTTTAANGHYYGQRASATDRKLYFNAAQIGSNTTNDAAAEASERNIRIMGSDDNGSIVFRNGRLGVAYLTDGTLTATEIIDFDALLRNYLFSPTGRPTS